MAFNNLDLIPGAAGRRPIFPPYYPPRGVPPLSPLAGDGARFHHPGMDSRQLAMMRLGRPGLGYPSNLYGSGDIPPIHSAALVYRRPYVPSYSLHHGDFRTHGCACGSSHYTKAHRSSSCSEKYDFKTKDIVIRDKARAVRASYLLENTKFEADLIKYIEKKGEDKVPDRVVKMLLGFINNDSYDNTDFLDEVTLNILASNAGAKSAVNHSLARLNEFTDAVRDHELASIAGTIVMSSKVDKGLKDWLKKLLKPQQRWHALFDSHQWVHLVKLRHEVVRDLEVLTNRRPQVDDEDYDCRVL